MGIVEGFGEQGVAEEGAEFSLAGKVLELGVIDDDGAGDGFAGVRVDDGLQRGLGLGGDELGEREAGRVGERIEDLRAMIPGSAASTEDLRRWLNLAGVASVMPAVFPRRRGLRRWSRCDG